MTPAQRRLADMLADPLKQEMLRAFSPTLLDDIQTVLLEYQHADVLQRMYQNEVARMQQEKYVYVQAKDKEQDNSLAFRTVAR